MSFFTTKKSSCVLHDLKCLQYFNIEKLPFCDDVIESRTFLLRYSFFLNCVLKKCVFFLDSDFITVSVSFILKFTNDPPAFC